jgi:polysaccharide pyruvyl transferase WcaK-like protein
MRIHHLYPRTRNIGDHFVQIGIERMVRRIVPGASFELFNVNRRGEEKSEYGLTRTFVERANRDADLVIIGGSNLYEGNYRWPWGVHLEAGALESLRVPLFLLGIGSGSNFLSSLHRPSKRAQREIRLLNDYSAFSGARDVITLDWLEGLGVSKAKLLGDPGTFVFNQPAQHNREGAVLITMPPLRFWSSKRHFWQAHRRGRPMFKALTLLAQTLLERGHKIVVACNDPRDLPVAQALFKGWFPGDVVCPETPEDYFRLLAAARAVVGGRLHTAVVAFSLGVPFILLDVDQRTNGFIKTYQLESWSAVASRSDIEARLRELADKLLSEEHSHSWDCFVEKRDRMYAQAMDLLQNAFRKL